MFIIFSGVSGAGKQTVIDALMGSLKNSQFVKSATTRPKRAGEDIHYHMSQAEFEKRLKNDEFFESENVHGFWYGILKKDLQNVIDHPEMLFFKDVDVHGTEKVVSFLKGKIKTLTIFLEVPDDLLFERLLKRGESEERAKTRISRGGLEREYKDRYDYVVENIDLDKTIKKIRQIIEKEQN